MEEKREIIKFEIYKKLIVTSNKQEITESVSDFIVRVIGYKPNPKFILKINDEDYICPILNIFKALLYLDCHSFKPNEKIKKYLDRAKTEKSVLKTKYNIDLESWEDNWIEIVDTLVNKTNKKVCDVLFKNANENPNDLLAFKIGMVIGLYSGDKEFLESFAGVYHKHADNHLDTNYIGLYAFIKEELREFEVSEKWVLKGLEINENNVWLQHVYAHIMYQTDRVEESITFLKQRKPTWEYHSNNFIKKHINWHLAISYLEEEDYSNSNEILMELLSCQFEDSECLLAILGYILRAYIRTEGSFKTFKYNKENDLIIIEYLRNLDIYTHHLLFDSLAIWFLFNLTTNDNEEIKTLLESIMKRIEENVESDVIHDNHREFYKKHYLNLIRAMKLFGESKYQEAMETLNKEESAIWKIGASDEQLLVLFEVELFCAYKCNDRSNFDRLVKTVFGHQLAKLKYIQKFERKLDLINFKK